MKLYVIVQRCYYWCNPKRRNNKMRDFTFDIKNSIQIVVKTFYACLKF